MRHYLHERTNGVRSSVRQGVRVLVGAVGVVVVAGPTLAAGEVSQVLVDKVPATPLRYSVDGRARNRRAEIVPPPEAFARLDRDADALPESGSRERDGPEAPSFVQLGGSAHGRSRASASVRLAPVIDQGT